MIDFAPALIGLSIHILIWEKLPEWGNWFNALLAKLPSPLRKLYDDWHCAYCAGFWIALALHLFADLWTIPTLDRQVFWPLSWFLDALATAVMIYAGSFAVAAISLPAMKAHQMKADFMATHFPDKSDGDEG